MSTMVTDSTKQKRETSTKYEVRHPRRTLWRRTWRFLVRTLAVLFVRGDIHGRRNFPKEGPAIIVANHTAFLEIAMLLAYAPYPLEFLTTGDIPLEPRFAFWAKLYGYIPVKRGSMDRKAMSKAVGVLEQGGVVALFPQGGIWETKVTQARTGVAWLSQKGNAPVVPIGFGGTSGSFAKAIRLQRPKITMHVGEPIAATPDKIEGLSRKGTLEHSAGEIMNAVYNLIPQWEKDSWQFVAEENYTLELIFTHNGQPIPPDDAPTVTEAACVSTFFHRPRLLDAMRRNLELDVGALEELQTKRDAAAFAAALDVVLGYVNNDNPFFLTYRFGNDEGKMMAEGLEQLRDVARWAAAQGYALNIVPVRHFRMEGQPEFTEQRYPVVDLEL